MVLDSKQTTVAYRCTKCGAGVMSVVGLFNLSADMIKLKCDCGGSEMTLVYTKDSKVRFTVPCLFCPNPHHFTVNSSVFFSKELFALPCPYSGMNIAVMGETNRVKAELSRSELELLDLLEKNGIESFDAIHGEQPVSDPQVEEIITYMIKELDDEGKIFCNCESDTEGDYEIEFLDSAIRVTCKKCGASAEIPTGSLIDAHEFLYVDELVLK
jgi:hypothetical protein